MTDSKSQSQSESESESCHGLDASRRQSQVTSRKSPVACDVTHSLALWRPKPATIVAHFEVHGKRHTHAHTQCHCHTHTHIITNSFGTIMRHSCWRAAATVAGAGCNSDTHLIAFGKRAQQVPRECHKRHTATQQAVPLALLPLSLLLFSFSLSLPLSFSLCLTQHATQSARQLQRMKIAAWALN